MRLLAIFFLSALFVAVFVTGCAKPEADSTLPSTALPSTHKHPIKTDQCHEDEGLKCQHADEFAIGVSELWGELLKRPSRVHVLCCKGYTE